MMIKRLYIWYFGIGLAILILRFSKPANPVVVEATMEVSSDTTELYGVINDTAVYTYVPVSNLIVQRAPSAYTEAQVEGYICSNERLKRAAWASEQLGCPISVILAMAMLEDGCATSELVKKTRNHGNIKCKCNRDPKLKRQHNALRKKGTPVCYPGYDKIEKGTDNYVVFKTDWSAWEKKVEILKRYRVVKEAKGKQLTAAEWAHVIHKSPYATDKRYGQKIMSLVNAWNLKALDKATNDIDVHLVTMTGKYMVLESKTCRNAGI